MDNKKRRLQKITVIFVALEAVFFYYLVGLLLVGYRPGHLLLGWKDLNVGPAVVNPLKYFPGLSYVLKTFFPLYFEYVYRVPPNIPLTLNAINQGYAALNFFSLFWIGLIIAIILTAILYAVKIRSKIFLGGTLVLMSILPIIFSIYPVMGNGVYFIWSLLYTTVNFKGIPFVSTYEVLLPYLLIGVALFSAGTYTLIPSARKRRLTDSEHIA